MSRWCVVEQVGHVVKHVNVFCVIQKTGFYGIQERWRKTLFTFCVKTEINASVKILNYLKEI